VLADPGQKKIQVIKEVRVLTGLGLREAKDLVDGSGHSPQTVLRGLSEADAERARLTLEAAGAWVKLVPSTDSPVPLPVGLAKPPGWGWVNRPQMVCAHCQQLGGVATKLEKVKKGVSGGKATAAVLTAGVSLFATGLSRKEQVTSARCSNCGVTWQL